MGVLNEKRCKDLESESPLFLEKLEKDELILLLAIVEQVYAFRNGHHQFVLKYIMKNTKYSKATGGTPIISWIPNQIGAVLKYMKYLIDKIGESENEMFLRIKEGYDVKVEVLNKQLEEFMNPEFNAEQLYKMNGSLDDTKVKF